MKGGVPGELARWGVAWGIARGSAREKLSSPGAPSVHATDGWALQGRKRHVIFNYTSTHPELSRQTQRIYFSREKVIAHGHENLRHHRAKNPLLRNPRRPHQLLERGRQHQPRAHVLLLGPGLDAHAR